MSGGVGLARRAGPAARQRVLRRRRVRRHDRPAQPDRAAGPGRQPPGPDDHRRDGERLADAGLRPARASRSARSAWVRWPSRRWPGCCGRLSTRPGCRTGWSIRSPSRSGWPSWSTCTSSSARSCPRTCRWPARTGPPCCWPRRWSGAPRPPGPLARGLNAVAKSVVRLLRVEPKDEVTSTFTADEVASILAESRREGLIEDQQGLVTGALAFAGRDAGEAAVPLAELVVLPAVGHAGRRRAGRGADRLLPVRGRPDDDGRADRLPPPQGRARGQGCRARRAGRAPALARPGHGRGR